MRGRKSGRRVMASIGIVYTLLAVFELWRGRGDDVWRWPVIVLLLAHAAAVPIHIRTVPQRPEHMLKYLTGLHLVGFGQASLIAAITSRMSE